jgi:hypothetical protein
MDNRSHDEAAGTSSFSDRNLRNSAGLDFDLDLTGFDPHEIDDFLSDPGDDDRANARRR